MVLQESQTVHLVDVPHVEMRSCRSAGKLVQGVRRTGGVQYNPGLV